MTDLTEQATRLDQISDRVEALQQQLAEEHEAHLQSEQKWIEEMAACQAREKVLRDALDEIGALNLAAKLSPVITTIVREALAQHTVEELK